MCGFLIRQQPPMHALLLPQTSHNVEEATHFAFGMLSGTTTHHPPQSPISTLSLIVSTGSHHQWCCGNRSTKFTLRKVLNLNGAQRYLIYVWNWTSSTASGEREKERHKWRKHLISEWIPPNKTIAVSSFKGFTLISSQMILHPVWNVSALVYYHQQESSYLLWFSLLCSTYLPGINRSTSAGPTKAHLRICPINKQTQNMSERVPSTGSHLPFISSTRPIFPRSAIHSPLPAEDELTG